MVITDPRLSFSSTFIRSKSVKKANNNSNEVLINSDKSLKALSQDNLKAYFLPSFAGKNDETDKIIDKTLKALTSKDANDLKASVNISGNTQNVVISFNNKDEFYQVIYKKSISDDSEYLDARIAIKNNQSGEEKFYKINKEQLERITSRIVVG